MALRMLNRRVPERAFNAEQEEAAQRLILDNLTRDEQVLVRCFDSPQTARTAYELVRLLHHRFRPVVEQRLPTLMKKAKSLAREYQAWALDTEPELLEFNDGQLPVKRPSLEEAAAYFGVDPFPLDVKAYHARLGQHLDREKHDPRAALQTHMHQLVIYNHLSSRLRSSLEEGPTAARSDVSPEL